MAVVEMVLERVCAVSLQVEKLLSLIRRTGELLCTLQGFHAQRFLLSSCQRYVYQLYLLLHQTVTEKTDNHKIIVSFVPTNGGGLG